MIVVTGAGRSGTKTVARVLNEMGVAMAGTEAGGWEDHSYRELNRAALHPVAISTHLWLKRAAFAVAERRTLYGSRPWGFKDPRAATLLWVWRSAADHMAEPFHVVYCKRHTTSIAASWAREYGNKMHDHLPVILSRVEAVERILPYLSHTVIDFGAGRHLTDDDVRAVITAQIKIPPPPTGIYQSEEE